MKIHLDKQSILPALTFVALFALLIIQFSYINRAADLEESNFNHRAIMALKDTRDEVARRVPSCNNMENYICGNYCPEAQRKAAAREVDSIMLSYLKIYKIDFAFNFQLVDTAQAAKLKKAESPDCYLQTLNGLLNDRGIHLRLTFPNRNQFLQRQITGLFLLSILFIGFILVSFILTHRLFRREKLQKQHTHDFIDNMVHEFQTPLANIRFATNLIRKKIPSIGHSSENDKLHDYTNILTRENEKLESHVQAILSIACSDKKQCTCEELNLHEVIETICNDFQFRAQQNGGQITLSLNASRFIVNGEPTQITLALSNMLDNALKYANGAPNIHVETTDAQGQVQLRIEDQGIGIAPQDLEFIFDKYFRVSTGDVHNVKGFGLGLCYVKKVIERYEGQISVKSVLNQGTQFTIMLPTN